MVYGDPLLRQTQGYEEYLKGEHPNVDLNKLRYVPTALLVSLGLTACAMGYEQTGDPLVLYGFAYKLVTETDCRHQDSVNDIVAVSEAGKTNTLSLIAEVHPNVHDRFDEFGHKAQELGFTLHDIAAENRKLYDTNDPAKLIDIANKYFVKHGIEVTLNDGFEPVLGTVLGSHLGEINATTLDVDRLRGSLQSALSAFWFIPEEVTNFAGVKKIVLTEGLKDYKGRPIAGFANIVSNDEFWIDVSSADAATYVHEFAHMLDAKICGQVGFLRDDMFKKSMGKYGHFSDSPREEKADLLVEILRKHKAIELINFGRPGTKAETALLLARLDAHIPGYAELLLS